MMIFAALPEATIRSVASSPSTPGMRTSMSTTSGATPPTRSTASRAVARLADHLDVVAGVEDHPEALANERLVVGDRDPDAHDAGPVGSRAWTRYPPPGSGPASSVPPTSDARSRIPISPWPPRAACAGGGPAVVAHLDLELVASVAQDHLDPGGASVAKRVRQRLLDDAVGGEVHARRQRRRLSLVADHDLEAAGAHGLGQLVDALEPRLRRGRVGALGRPHRAQQPPQLGQGLAAGALDRADRRPGLIGARVEHVVGGARPGRRSPRRCGRSRRGARVRSAPARRSPRAAPPR